MRTVEVTILGNGTRALYLGQDVSGNLESNPLLAEALEAWRAGGRQRDPVTVVLHAAVPEEAEGVEPEAEGVESEAESVVLEDNEDED